MHRRSSCARWLITLAWSIATTAAMGCNDEVATPGGGPADGDAPSDGGSDSGGGGEGAVSSDGGASSNGGAGGDPASGGAAEGGGGAASLASLSDAFDGSALDASWTIFRPDAASVRVSSGALEIAMTKRALWFENDTSVLVYKPIDGDFVATSRVHARRASSPAEVPAEVVELGGIMARDPDGSDQGGTENYVFVVVGRDVDDDLSVETKTTTESVSRYDGPAWPSADAELRVCRVGSTFVLAKRGIGDGTWIVAATYARPDLPPTLQVGVQAYDNDPDHDLLVTFEEVTFRRPLDEADCLVD